jgi:hypothetical protein
MAVCGIHERIIFPGSLLESPDGRAFVRVDALDIE